MCSGACVCGCEGVVWWNEHSCTGVALVWVSHHVKLVTKYKLIVLVLVVTETCIWWHSSALSDSHHSEWLHNIYR